MLSSPKSFTKLPQMLTSCNHSTFLKTRKVSIGRVLFLTLYSLFIVHQFLYSHPFSFPEFNTGANIPFGHHVLLVFFSMWQSFRTFILLIWVIYFIECPLTQNELVFIMIRLRLCKRTPERECIISGACCDYRR